MTRLPERNFAELIDRAPRSGRALIELARDGSRRAWSFGEVAVAAGHLAGALRAHGIGQGDVVLTLIGNRVEWVLSMLACLRIGAAVLPCTEQLRTYDLAWRLQVARPAIVLADERNREELTGAAPACPILWLPDADLLEREPAPAPVALRPEDPALLTFTSGTSGAPKAVVHGQRYLWGQRLQARHWLGAESGRLVWCTASSGWSKSARNAFIAPWLCGAAALLHDGRFEPDERLAILERERVAVLCMAPTEYRMIARRSSLRPLPALRSLVAAGEALDPAVLEAWSGAVGRTIRDGYGQTETGQLTGVFNGQEVRPGSMGRPLPGVGVTIENGELVVDPATVPTFFLGYLGADPPLGRWRTGDRVRRDDDGFLWFEGRLDDVIVSSGYRIGPFEVESILLEHEAVAETAVIGAPDDDRGAVVRAVVVLREGHAPSAGLAKELQAFVRARTAPYKYPRIVDFATALPKTPSGKVRRAALR